jgi:hypothetical protein
VEEDAKRIEEEVNQLTHGAPIDSLDAQLGQVVKKQTQSTFLISKKTIHAPKEGRRAWPRRLPFSAVGSGS